MLVATTLRTSVVFCHQRRPRLDAGIESDTAVPRRHPKKPAGSFCYTSYQGGTDHLQKPIGGPVILGAVLKTKDLFMSKRIVQIVAIAALTAAASLPAVAGDMNNALGGALGGVAGAALGGAGGRPTGALTWRGHSARSP